MLHDPIANLHRVEPLLRKALGAALVATFDVDAEWHWAWRARIRSRGMPELGEVVIRGAADFFDLHVPELDVGTRIESVAWDLVDLRGVISALADVTVEYLSGRGEVESHGQGTKRTHVLYVETAVGEWVLGRNVSVTPQEW